jgi:c-di-GMP-binding flagellar brake protein YcgR
LEPAVNSFDRRQDRRKELPNDLFVELTPQELTDGGPALVGRAIDLTMGGIGVVLPEPLESSLHDEVWTVAFALPDKSGRTRLAVNCVITHGRPHPEGHFYGLKFHEIHAPARANERAALRQFLLSDLRDQWRGNPMIQAPSVSA